MHGCIPPLHQLQAHLQVLLTSLPLCCDCLFLLQRHAQAQEALEALPAHRELVQQQQELQVRLRLECVFAFSQACGWCAVRTTCNPVRRCASATQQWLQLPCSMACWLCRAPRLAAHLRHRLPFWAPVKPAAVRPKIRRPIVSPPQARISGLENDLASMRVDIKASQDKVRSASANIAALEKVGGWELGMVDAMVGWQVAGQA